MLNRMTLRPRTRHLTAPALVAVAFTASACGGTATTANPTGTADVSVLAIDTRFDQTEYSAKAGDVKIEYVSRGSLVHTLLLQDANGDRVKTTDSAGDAKDFLIRINSGEVKSATVPLVAGAYTLYCDLPQHRSQGMEAKLTVT